MNAYKEYNDLMNEGGEGYNPYETNNYPSDAERAARKQKEIQEIESDPNKTIISNVGCWDTELEHFLGTHGISIKYDRKLNKTIANASHEKVKAALSQITIADGENFKKASLQFL